MSKCFDTLIIADGFNTIKEVLFDKEDAILIEPESHEQAIEAIKSALSNGYHQKYSESAYKKANSLYTWDYRAQEIIKFIKNSN
jgi:glycosyltransferase involved in cell wall biosynthesis